MLKVPQLDDLEFDQMIQRAVSRIPAMTDQWTDFNSHDPGITVLQTYAWLTDMLNYYMNATGDVHVEKYLKLLGVEPKRECASEGYVVLEHFAGELIVPAGSVFLAGNIPFETAEEQHYKYNSFCSFINETDGIGIDLTAFAGQDGEYAEGFGEHFEKEAVIYLGFEEPLVSGDRLYVCVDENTGRNPFEQDFQLCDLKWQYHTADGWKELDVKDDTCGFLRSGFITVSEIEDMAKCQHPAGMTEAFYVRCILRENTYDCLPKIGMIYVNPLKVVQQHTVCQEGEFLPELKIGKTNGCADQELEFDYPDAYRFSLALWSLNEEDEAVCEIWHRTDELEQADYMDKVFAYDRERNVVRFGDGIHGAVPMQNMPVSVTGLVCSRLDRGNVLAGEIRNSQLELPAGCRIYNPAPTTGGRASETVADMLRRMEEAVFAQNRMASGQDYEERILQTPGLMLDLVHVIPGKIYGDLHRQSRSANEIVAVVKPKSSDKRPVLSEAYLRRIEAYIEPYRLLNTKVSIVSPEYVGIEVHGKIALHHDTPEVQKAVGECLKDAVEYGRKREPFGCTIAYGRLFTRLESLAEVRQVKELSLERVGGAAVKNERGDVLLHEDALSYLKAVDLEFCQ